MEGNKLINSMLSQLWFEGLEEGRMWHLMIEVAKCGIGSSKFKVKYVRNHIAMAPHTKKEVNWLINKFKTFWEILKTKQENNKAEPK